MPIFLQFDCWSLKLGQLNYVFQNISFFPGISHVVGIKCSGNSSMKTHFLECENTPQKIKKNDVCVDPMW